MGLFSFRNGLGDVIEWEGGSASRLAVAEIALTFSSVLLTFLVLLSAIRPRIYHQRVFFKFGLMVTPWVCYPLIFYIIGVARSSPFTDDLSVFLACSALLLVGLAESTLCYRISNHKHNGWVSLQQLLHMLFVLVVMIFNPKLIGNPRLLSLFLIPTFLVWLTRMTARSRSTRTRMCVKDDLLISEYMANKHSVRGGVCNTSTMVGYNYIVSGEVVSTSSEDLLWMLRPEKSNPGIKNDEVVTVEDIWQHFKSNDVYTSKLRDVCLSFALFKLLRRRIRGCYLHESGLAKTRKFVIHGLLSDSDIKTLRAFRVIEVELGFLFDFFYSSHWADRNYVVTVIGWIVWIGLVYPISFSNYFGKPLDQNIRVFINDTNLGFLRLIIPAMFFCLGCIQFVSLTFSPWNKVNILVSRCLRHKLSSSKSLPRNRGPLFMFLSSVSSGSYWSNNAHQYSLLNAAVPAETTAEYFLYWVTNSLSLVKEREIGTRKVRIPDEAKRALLSSLKLTEGNLSDGRASLRRNGAQLLSWACYQEFVAEKIIVWHVATTLCHVPFTQKLSLTSTTETRNNHRVATMLSNYCAYLVAFAPELLADDVYATRLVFNSVSTTARERIEGEGSVHKMYESASKMVLEKTEFTPFTQHDVVFQGKMLGSQLLQLNDDWRWRVLADFWAELMLFVVPADNAAAHLERLKTGGELITHIWALLTHAGILQRPSGDGYKGKKIYSTQKEHEEVILEISNPVVETTSSEIHLYTGSP